MGPPRCGVWLSQCALLYVGDEHLQERPQVEYLPSQDIMFPDGPNSEQTGYENMFKDEHIFQNL